MSQNGTPLAADENLRSITAPASFYFPMVPMYYPYRNENIAGQRFYAPLVYPNVSTYAPLTSHFHGNAAMNYNTIYNGFCPISNNIIPQTSHMTSPVPIVPPSLLSSSSLTFQRLPIGSLLVEENVERNKNLNIRECQSPSIDQTQEFESSLETQDANHNNVELPMTSDSSSTSPLMSRTESNTTRLPLSSDIDQNIHTDNSKDDFLTFIKQKTKAKTAMPELNPFANEFCFVNSKTSLKDSSNITNSNSHDEINENQSSYRLLFNNLIEKSLESIEAINKSKKKTSVNDISVQCDSTTYTLDRSTQTLTQTNNFDLIEKYSSSTVKLMDKLLVNFRNVYQNQMHEKYHSMAETCDELRHLVLLIRCIVSSFNNNNLRGTSSIHLDNPFSSIIQDLPNDILTNDRYQTSAQIKYSATGSDTHCSIAATTNSSISSCANQQINEIATVNSKICLICLKPLGDTENVVHTFCRSLVHGSSVLNKNISQKDA